MNDEDVLPAAKIVITIGLSVMILACGLSVMTGDVVPIAFAIGGFVCLLMGLTLLVFCYSREEKMVVWNGMISGENAKCTECGTPAHVFRPEHEEGALCVVCGGTIKLFDSEEKLEVDDVFGSGATVGGDAPQGSGD